MNEDALKVIMHAFSVLLKTQPVLNEDDWDVVGLATSLVAIELLITEERPPYVN